MKFTIVNSSENMFNEIDKTFKFYIVMFIITILILAFILIIIMNQLFKPLNDLIANIRSLTLKVNKNSNLDQVKSSNEIQTIKQSFDFFVKLINKERAKIEEYNKNLEERIKKEVEENRKKELQIFEQSKMVSLGNMIGNIAHQWRQPLSIISTVSSAVQLKKDIGNLDNKYLDKSLENINTQVQYLSDTINIFRDFVKEKKELKELVLQERIDKALNILDASLKNHFIKLINDIDYSKSVKVKMVQGELEQVIINIINNAKDVLIEKKIKEPWIKIELVKSEMNIVLTIEDNAGGVPDNIISHIFEPYFTTKHQSQGTGLGLHMSYKIVVESLKGKLYVKNTKYGAKFFIEFPLNVDSQ